MGTKTTVINDENLYNDQRIAAFYDDVNPLAEDSDFFMSLAGRNPIRILDIGCGTGLLSTTLANRFGHEVTGVDPAEAMLNIARKRRHGNLVEWCHASAQSFSSQRKFDLAIMTGHAFQCLLTQDDRVQVFRNVVEHLAEGGRFAFDSRNPNDQAWRRWVKENSYQAVSNLGEAAVIYNEAELLPDQTVIYKTVLNIENSANRLETVCRIAFPSREEICLAANEVGLALLAVYGLWDKTPFRQDSAEMIFLFEKG